MGLSQLTLVAPKEFPSKEAEDRASHAEDILENTKIYRTLEEALTGCTLVLGSSGRLRELSLPIFSPREAAEKIKQHLQTQLTAVPLITATRAVASEPSVAFATDVAILYGNEQHGLSNEELGSCAAQIVIPTAGIYASLNLAQAVQIISYEIFLALSEMNISSVGSKKNLNLKEGNIMNNTLPNFESLTEFYHALEKTLIHLHYLDPKKPGNMMLRLKHLFSRALIDKTELTLLRGLLSAIENKTK